MKTMAFWAAALPLLLAQAEDARIFVSQETVPYGVCAHVTRDEFATRDRVYQLAKAAGIGYVRSDFDWNSCQREKGGPLDFTKYDTLVADAEKMGITILPIVYNPPHWAYPAQDHLEEWREFAAAVARHFGQRLPVLEIWNEENIEGFWKHPDAAAYAKTLQAAYEGIKSVDPTLKVAFGGLAGMDLKFVEGVYQAGGQKYFDLMNVHPYTHPEPPEGRMDVNLRKLKDLMAKYGDAEKPVWITEMGWPTHRATISNPSILLAGLKVARPEKKAWNIVYADIVPIWDSLDLRSPKALEELLPPGSKVEACGVKRTLERLAAGDVDAVMYPIGERYPAESAEAIRKFVAAGGTLIAIGGAPMYFRVVTENGFRVGPDNGDGAPQDRAAVRIGFDAWWMNSNLPEETKVIPTELAVAAGLKSEPTGFTCQRFFDRRELKRGDEMVPLLVGKGKDGSEIVGAAVYKFNSDYHGRVLVNGIKNWNDMQRVATEPVQAYFTARALALSFALGIESYFTYELQAVEQDPYYSEHHFGIVHRDGQPKPAYAAYKAFTAMRPRGSVNVGMTVTPAGDGPKSEVSVYRVEWKQPSGRRVVMWWCTGREASLPNELPAHAEVYDVYGKLTAPQQLTGSPIYVVLP